MIIITILSIVLLGLMAVVVLGNNIILLPLAPSEEEFDEEAYQQNMLYERDIQLNKLAEELENNPQEPINYEELPTTNDEEEFSESEKEIIAIIEKFYPGAVEETREKVAEELKDRVVLTKGNYMFEAEKEMYYKILDIIETKSITEEEKEALKNFLQDELWKIEEDEELYQRISSIV